MIPLTADARVTCIRLTSNHIADTTDLKRFGQFHKWRDKGGNELALAIWKYLSDHETGLYHFNEILEGPDPFDEYATVRDPLKIMNTYNMAYCGIFGPVTDGIFQGVGFTKGRSFGLEAWNHCATEVWYDNGWHYFDVDVRGALLRPDGVVASLAEAQNNRSLWVDPVATVTPFFPNTIAGSRWDTPWISICEAASRSPVSGRPRVAVGITCLAIPRRNGSETSSNRNPEALSQTTVISPGGIMATDSLTTSQC
jgi:hypothetical protein